MPFDKDGNWIAPGGKWATPFDPNAGKKKIEETKIEDLQPRSSDILSLGRGPLATSTLQQEDFAKMGRAEAPTMSSAVDMIEALNRHKNPAFTQSQPAATAEPFAPVQVPAAPTAPNIAMFSTPQTLDEYYKLSEADQQRVPKETLDALVKQKQMSWFDGNPITKAIKDNVLEPFSNVMDKLLNDNPVGQTVGRAGQQMAQRVTGIELDANQQVTTGNETLDKAADLAGLAGYFIDPAAASGGIASMADDAAGALARTGLGQAAKSATDEAVQGVMGSRLGRALTGAEEAASAGALKAPLPLVERDAIETALRTGVKAAGIGGAADYIKGATTPDLESRNLAEKIGSSMTAGTGDTIEQIGSAAKWLGYENLGNDLQEYGQKTKKGYEVEQQEFTWKSLLDPEFYAVNVARTVPTSLSLMPLALAGGSLASGVGAVVGMGAFGRSILQSIGAAALATPFEAALEAGGVYEDMRKKGATPEEADKAADRTFRLNAALLGVTNYAEFATAFLPKGFLGALDTTAGRIGVGAASGGFEEGAQGAISSTSKGEGIQINPEEVAVGAIMGAGFSAVGSLNESRDAIQHIQHKVIQKLDDQTRADMNEALEEAKSLGIPEEEAMAQIMEAIAGDESGQQKIQEAVQELVESTGLSQATKAAPDLSAALPAPTATQTSKKPSAASTDALTQAKALIMDSGVAAVSTLQKGMGIGYTKAADLIDQLTAEGFLGEYNGTGPRQIIGQPTEPAAAVPELATESVETAGGVPELSGENPEMAGIVPENTVGSPDLSGIVPKIAETVPEPEQAQPVPATPAGENSLLDQAKAAITSSGKAAVSVLQRELRIGYTDAANILDQLEAEGFIGAYDGTNPREIIGNAPAAQSQAEAPVAEPATAAKLEPEIGKWYTDGKGNVGQFTEWFDTTKGGRRAKLTGADENSFVVADPAGMTETERPEKVIRFSEYPKTAQKWIKDKSFHPNGYARNNRVEMTEIDGELYYKRSDGTGGKVSEREYLGFTRDDGQKVETGTSTPTPAETPAAEPAAATSGAAMSLNSEKGGVEIRFNDRPDAKTVEKLQKAKFKYHKKGKYWYAKQTNGTMQTAGEVTGDFKPYWEHVHQGQVAEAERLRNLDHDMAELSAKEIQNMADRTKNVLETNPNMDPASRPKPETSEASRSKGKAQHEVTRFLTAPNKGVENFTPTHTYRGLPVEVMEVPETGVMAYRYETLQKNLPTAKAGGQIRLDNAEGMAELRPISEPVSEPEQSRYQAEQEYKQMIAKLAGNSWKPKTQLKHLQQMKEFAAANGLQFSERHQEKMDQLNGEVNPPVEQPSAPAPENVLNDHHAKMKERAERARQRIKDKYGSSGTTLNSGLPLDLMADLTIIGYTKLLDGVADFKAWADEMVKESPHGERTRKWLPAVFAQAQHINSLPEAEVDAFLDELLTDAYGENPDQTMDQPADATEGLSAAKAATTPKDFEKLYFSVNPNKDELEAVKRAKPKNVLISFARWQKKSIKTDLLDVIGYRPENIIVDSGAFSFKGKPVGLDTIFEMYAEQSDIFDATEIAQQVRFDLYNLDRNPDSALGNKSKELDLPVFHDYIEFLDTNRANVDYVMTLDDMSDPEASRFSFEVMQEMGYNLIPVFHFGDDLQYLSSYLAYGADYIALGGSALTPDGKRRSPKERIEWAKPIIEKFPDVKFHMLGTNDQYIIDRLPGLYSADGTRWQVAGREGRSGLEERAAGGAEEIVKREAAVSKKAAAPESGDTTIEFDGRTFTIIDRSHPTRFTIQDWQRDEYEISRSLLNEGGEGIVVRLKDGAPDSLDMTAYWHGKPESKLLLEEATERELYPDGTDPMTLGYDKMLFRIQELDKYDSGEYVSKDQVFTKEEAINVAETLLRETYGSKALPATAISEKVIARGKESNVITENGREVKTVFALVGANDLIASHDLTFKENPDYPQEVQPRDRARAGMQDQVRRMSGSIRPSLLGDSPKAGDGAPIVGPDLVVESGNGRSMALQMMYENRTDSLKAYRSWLTDHAASFGFTKKQVHQSIHHGARPILVRIRLTELDRVAFAKEANQQSVAAMSPTEQATADSQKLTDSLLKLFNPGEDADVTAASNRDFVRSFMGQVVPASERSRYMDKDGHLNQSGVTRIQNAVFAKAYGESRAVERLAESTDNNVKNITGAMLIAAPRIAQIKEGIKAGRLHDLDLSGDIAAAMLKLSDLRDSGQTVEDYFNQGDLFGAELGDESKNILAVFDANKRSRKRITSLLQAYADIVEAAGDPRQTSLFGEDEAPTKLDTLEAAIRRAENEDGNQIAFWSSEGINGEETGEAGREEETRTEESEKITFDHSRIYALQLKQDKPIQDYDYHELAQEVVDLVIDTYGIRERMLSGNKNQAIQMFKDAIAGFKAEGHGVEVKGVFIGGPDQQYRLEILANHRYLPYKITNFRDLLEQFLHKTMTPEASPLPKIKYGTKVEVVTESGNVEEAIFMGYPSDAVALVRYPNGPTFKVKPGQIQVDGKPSKLLYEGRPVYFDDANGNELGGLYQGRPPGTSFVLVKGFDGNYYRPKPSELRLETKNTDSKAAESLSKTSKKTTSESSPEAQTSGRSPNPLPEDPNSVDPEHFRQYVTAMRGLIDSFKALLPGNLPKTQAGLRKAAAEALGRPATEDEWSDALEAALQEHVADIAKSSGQADVFTEGAAKAYINAGQQMEALLKNAGRSLEKMERQQYSTPIPLAAIAGYALDALPGKTVKEGSAGTGSLILPLQSVQGITAQAVEMSPRRAAILTAMGFEVTNSDTFKVTAKADSAIGNPPFRGENVGRGKSEFAGNPPWKGGWGDLGNRFLNWDLRSLADKGRLVHITAPGVINGKQNAEFRAWLLQNHTVRAMVTIHEGGYDSRGTSFGAGIIVVDKGKTANAPEPITGTAESWNDLLAMLEPLKGEGTHARLDRNQTAGSSTAGTGTTNQASPVRGGQPGSGAAGTGNAGRVDSGTESKRTGRSNRGGSAQPSRETGNGASPGQPESGQPAAGVVPGNEERVSNGLSGQSGRAGSNDASRVQDNEKRKSRARADIDVSGFVEYVPGRSITGEKHRGHVVEVGNLAIVSAPEEVYTNKKFEPHPRVLKGGEKRLSDAQLESIMLAKYNWHREKRGILIADDTGIGKTAEQLGIAADAWHEGRAKRILIVTTKDTVARGFLRENEEFDLGLPMTFVNAATYEKFKDAVHQQSPDSWRPLPVADGVMVVSQYTFKDSTKALHQWLNDGKGDVLVLFDESHDYSNPDSKRGDAAVELYRNFRDKAQFIYSSATAAENLNGLEHLYGLKLWGPDEFGDFQTRLKGYEPSKGSGGKTKQNALSKALGSTNNPFDREIPLAMMEQIVRELKMEGQYIGRSLSMEGIDMVPVAIELTPKDRGDWNRAVEFVQRIAAKAEEHGNKPTDRGKIMSQVVGYMRRLRNFYVMKGIIADIKQRQASGELGRFVLSGEFIGSDDDGAPASLQAAIRAINDQSKSEGSAGETVYYDIPEALDDKASLQAALMGESADYDFQKPTPELPSPIKMLYDAFGDDNVAIITGEVKDSERDAQMKAFTSGKVPVMFFNKAGNTGISLHDTIGQKIGFYHVDYPYDAKSAKQSEGRVNRTGQVTQPVFFYPYTDSSVDSKFVGTLLARYESMGALSRGKSSKIGGDALGSFDFTGPVAEQTVYRFVPQLDVDDRALMFGEYTRSMPTGEDLDESSIRSMFGSTGVNVKKFINYLMFLDFETGNRIFKQFTDTFQTVKEEVEAAGGVTDKFRTFKGKELSASEGNGGVVLRKVQTLTTEAEKKAARRRLAKAEVDVEETQEALADARQEGRLKLQEQVERAKEKRTEAQAAYDKLLPEVQAARRNPDVSEKEYERISRRFEKVRLELSNQIQREDELSRKWKRLTNGDETVYDEIPTVRRAQSAYDSAQYRLLNAEAEAEMNDVVMITDGKIATNGLMVPIRAALRTAAKAKYNTDSPPQAALKLELRAYTLEDGRKVVGAVIPTWAEGEVAKALNTRVMFQGSDNSQLVEHLKAGHNVALEGGFELLYQPKNDQIVIKGMSASQHKELFKQLQSGGFEKDFGYNPVSKAFVVTQRGLERLLQRYPVKNAGGGAVGIEERLAEKMRQERGNNSLGIVPKALQARRKVKKTESPHAFQNEEIEKRFSGSKLKKETLWMKIGEQVATFKRRITREFEHLPKTAEFARLRAELLRLESQKGVATDRTFRNLLQGITRQLDPDQFDLFRRKVMLDDLYQEHLRKNALPWGFDSETLLEEKAIIDESVDADETVQLALETRRDVWAEIKANYFKAMGDINFDVTDRLQREDYFRHQVIEFANQRVDSSGKSSLRTPTSRGFLKGRGGEYAGDINSDYLQAESEVMIQMLYDTERAKSIKLVKDQYNIKDQTKKDAKEHNASALQDAIEQEISSRKYTRKPKPSDEPMLQLEGDSSGLIFYSPTEDALKEFAKKQAIAYAQLARMNAADMWAGENGEYADVVRYLTGGKLKVDDLMETMNTDSFDDSGMSGRVFKYFAELAGKSETVDADGNVQKMPAGVIQARTILKAVGQKRALIREALGKNYRTWRQMIPSGYVAWQPDKGDHFFMAQSLNYEKLAVDLARGALNELGVTEIEEYLDEVLVRGSRKMEYVIKEEVAATLDNLMREENNGWFYKLNASTMQLMKVQMLIGPTRVIKYNLRNITGDLDKTFAANPRALKKVPQAIKELAPIIFKNGTMSPVFREWFNRGGMQTVLQVQEMGEVNQLKMFMRFYEKEGSATKRLAWKAWDSYWKNARNVTDFREAILRYANYLEYLEQIQKSKDGKPLNYGASIPSNIDALSTAEDKAYKLSNEAMIDYTAISAQGREWRKTLIPFYSFIEGNMRSTIQVFKNAAYDEKLAGAVGRKLLGKTVARSPYYAYRVGSLALKVSLLTILLQLWNGLFDDEEEDLPEDVRRQAHIIIGNPFTGNGRDAKGKVRYFNRIGALEDFLEWFGIDDLDMDVKDILNNRKTLSEVVEAMIKKPINKAAQSLNPVNTFLVEQTIGKELYPSVFEPSDLQDRWENLAGLFGVNKEYNALQRYVNDIPGPKYNPRDLLDYGSDPGQAAYYNIIDMKKAYMKRIGKPMGKFTGGGDNPKTDAAYKAKMALRYGDKDALKKYLMEYAAQGGTADSFKTSLKNMDPLNGLSDADKSGFYASLDEDDKEMLKKAQNYFGKTLLGREPME